MNVKQILSLKGSTAVETVSPPTTLRDAAATLSEKGYGALVVSHGDGTISGILSERDIVRAVGREGAAALARPVASAMTETVVTCAPGESVHSVMERMTDGRFRHMPVMEDGRMVGLLSIGDVVKARIFEMEEENSQLSTMLHG
jgi:CBS domain-containing protein